MCFTALHKIGAVVIPASFQLTPHDLVYRLNAAGVKMLVTVDDAEIIQHCEDSLADCPTVETYAVLGEQIPAGAVDFAKALAEQSDVFERPTGEDSTKVTDTMLLYFSSGTTGMPKMVRHDYSHPLGQITTARFWQCVQENRVHLTQTDSGWAKFAWGKIYGQWICGACIGAYDTEKFTPHGMLEAIQRLRPCTFCAPATIYRFLIKEDLTQYDFSFIEHASLAGEPLNPEVFNQIERQTGLRIHEASASLKPRCCWPIFRGWKSAPAPWANPPRSTTSICSMRTETPARTVSSARSASKIRTRSIQPACSVNTGKRRTRWPVPGKRRLQHGRYRLARCGRLLLVRRPQ